MKKIKPEARRAIITVSSRQGMGFFEALNFLVYEGIKALGNRAAGKSTCQSPAEIMSDYEMKSTTKKRKPICVDDLWIR